MGEDLTIRGKVAIVGVGETTYYKWGQSPDPEFVLVLKAILAACEDGLGRAWTPEKGSPAWVRRTKRAVHELGSASDPGKDCGFMGRAKVARTPRVVRPGYHPSVDIPEIDTDDAALALQGFHEKSDRVLVDRRL